MMTHSAVANTIAGRMLSGESLIGYERMTHAVNLSHSCWSICVGTGYAVGIEIGRAHV